MGIPGPNIRDMKPPAGIVPSYGSRPAYNFAPLFDTEECGMNLTVLMRCCLVLWVAGVWCSRSLAAEPITPAQFGPLHALIKPAAAEEKWQQIPWLTSLW